MQQPQAAILSRPVAAKPQKHLQQSPELTYSVSLHSTLGLILKSGYPASHNALTLDLSVATVRPGLHCIHLNLALALFFYVRPLRSPAPKVCTRTWDGALNWCSYPLSNLLMSLPELPSIETPIPLLGPHVAIIWTVFLPLPLKGA